MNRQGIRRNDEFSAALLARGAPDQAARVHFGRSGRAGRAEPRSKVPALLAKVEGVASTGETGSVGAMAALPGWQQRQSSSAKIAPRSSSCWVAGAVLVAVSTVHGPGQ